MVTAIHDGEDGAEAFPAAKTGDNGDVVFELFGSGTRADFAIVPLIQ